MLAIEKSLLARTVPELGPDPVTVVTRPFRKLAPMSRRMYRSVAHQAPL